MSDTDARLDELERRMNEYHPPSNYHVKMVVAVRSLHLREYPPDGPTVAGLKRGDVVYLTDEVIYEDGLKWCNAQYTNDSGAIYHGWCAEKYLREPVIEKHKFDTDILASQYRIAYLLQDEPNRVTDEFWGGGPSYPCTVAQTINGVQIPRRRMSRGGFNYFYALNAMSGGTAQENMNHIESGYFNGQPQHDWENPDDIPDDDLPKNEFATTGGNPVAVEAMGNGWIKPVCWQRFDDFPDIHHLNMKNGALVVHHFQAMHKDYDSSYVDISSPTRIACTGYIPLTEPNGESGVIRMVDKYTERRYLLLPDTIRENYRLTPRWNIPVRSSPEIQPGNRAGHLIRGVKFQVVNFYPTTSGIWARVGDNRYAALGYQPHPGKSYTVWSTEEFSLDGWMPLRPRVAD